MNRQHRIYLIAIVLVLANFSSASGFQDSVQQSANPSNPPLFRLLGSEPDSFESLSPEEIKTQQDSPLIKSSLETFDQEFSNPSPLSNSSPASERSRWQQVSNIPVSLGVTWLTDAQTGLTNYDTGIKFPILKIFGSPPPIVKTSFSFTDLLSGPNSGLPRELYEYSIGISKVYRLSDRWTVRSMLGMVLATDNRNRSSDAWLFRGGVFGIYQASDQWQWTVGAIALGRDDLPAVPALGAIWTPNPHLRLDLIPPNPKMNFLVSQSNQSENWLYLGGGFDGTTWGYRKLSDQNDQLTYRDLRVVAGWQLRPRSEPGVPFVRGRKYNFEIGYNFRRELEWNAETTELHLDDAWMFRLQTNY